MASILLNRYKVSLLSMDTYCLILSIKKILVVKKAILGMMLSVYALSSHAVVTITDNPFYSDVEVEHPLFVKGASGSQCKGLLRVYTQMVSFEQSKQALKCGNTKLDRDNDGVPCESICLGG